MGACCGGYARTPAADERNELVKEDASLQSTITSRLSDWKSKLLATAGHAPPDPDYDAALELLREGTMLQVNGEMVQVKASADGSMLTWQSLELINNMPKVSGALPLSKIGQVDRQQASAMGAWLGGPRGPALVLHHAQSGEQVRMEAANEPTRNAWADAVERVSAKQLAEQEKTSAERGIARTAAKELELRSRRQDAERRKQAIIDSMRGGGGMKHTAVAMMQRSH